MTGPSDGVTLVVGPANVGKTRTTARRLEQWLDERGPDGVVVLEFAPVVERDGRVLGGRLDRFCSVPDEVFHGIVEAHAPRTEARDAETALELARDNADRARHVVVSAPADPTAVFVNDATIPAQADGRTDWLRSYCSDAQFVVVNALESDELGTDDTISRNERGALSELREWADRVVALS